MKKPYDTTPIEMDTAEEPALAYGTGVLHTPHPTSQPPSRQGRMQYAPTGTPAGDTHVDCDVAHVGARHASPMTAAAHVKTGRAPSLPEGIDQTTPFVITKSGQKWWNIDIETAEELEKRIENIENGTSKPIPWDDMMKRLRERSAQRKQERKKTLEYV